MDNYAQQLTQELESYYRSQGIVPGQDFNCIHYQEGRCPDDPKDGILARGMQCHIGPLYGNGMKIMVASLDCGLGGASTIEHRTDSVINDAKGHTHTPHMRGTYKALSFFLNGSNFEELVKYVVITNTCKCCFKHSSHHLNINYYMNCGAFTVQEILKIRPDVILFQGENAPAFCIANNYFPDEKQTAVKAVHSSLRIFFDAVTGFKSYAVFCIHPSARGRSSKKKRVFYDEELPLIAKYIKEHPLDAR